MHENSLEAYDTEKPKLGERANRITELVKYNLLHEVGKKKCPATNKSVRIVIHNQQNQMELF